MPNQIAVQITTQAPGPDDLAKAEAGGKAIATAAAKGTTQVQVAVQQLGNTVTTGLTPLQKFAQGLTRLDARESTRGMFALRSGLLGLSQSATGATGPVGRLGESLLAFGVGGGVGLIALAGFAAVGAAIKGLTAPLEAVTRDAAAMSAQFEKVATTAHPGIAAMEQLLAVRQQVEQAHEDAKPNFWEIVFGSGIPGMLGGGPIVDDLITAQKTFANMADATAKSLESVQLRLIAIGQTKSVLQDVATQMRAIGDVGSTLTRFVPTQPAAGVRALDPRFDVPAHTETTATGLVGALRQGIATLPTNLPASDRAQAIETLTRGFTVEAGKALEAAGQQITPLPLLDGMFHNAEQAIRTSGLAPKIANELIAQLQGELLRAIEAEKTAIGEGPLLPSIRGAGSAMLRGQGLATLNFISPTEARSAALALGVGGTQGGTFNALAPDALSRLNAQTGAGLSAVGNLKALDDGAAAARKFAEETNKAANKVAEAGEKFAVTLTRSVGDAVLMLGRNPSAGGVLAAGSSVLSTFAQQRFTPEDQAADPTKIAGTLEHPGLALPTTLLSIGAGLVERLKGLFGSGQHVITIGGYTPAALAQLRELSGSGTLVAVNASNSADLATLQYQLNRRSRQDATPRIPVTTPGPGNS